jgi:hypothetical protein
MPWGSSVAAACPTGCRSSPRPGPHSAGSSSASSAPSRRHGIAGGPAGSGGRASLLSLPLIARGRPRAGHHADRHPACVLRPGPHECVGHRQRGASCPAPARARARPFASQSGTCLRAGVAHAGRRAERMGREAGGAGGMRGSARPADRGAVQGGAPRAPLLWPQRRLRAPACRWHSKRSLCWPTAPVETPCSGSSSVARASSTPRRSLRIARARCVGWKSMARRLARSRCSTFADGGHPSSAEGPPQSGA